MIVLQPASTGRRLMRGRRCGRGTAGWSRLRDDIDRTVASIDALIGLPRPAVGVTDVVLRNAERADRLAGLAEQAAERERSRSGRAETLWVLQVIATELGQSCGELGEVAHALGRGGR